MTSPSEYDRFKKINDQDIRCDRCVHFWIDSWDDKGREAGECRRYPPMTPGAAVWPYVQWYEGCSEFIKEAREEQIK